MIRCFTTLFLLIQASLVWGQEWATYPLPSADSAVSVVMTVEGLKADLLILDKHTLLLYKQFQQEAPDKISLPEDVSAVDIVDIDGDGIKSIIGIGHNRFVRIPLYGPDAGQEELLFERPISMVQEGASAYFFVSVLFRDSVPYFMVPGEDTLEICRKDGTLVDTIPVGGDAQHLAEYGHFFRQYVPDPPRLGTTNSLEFVLSQEHAITPVLPTPWAADEPVDPLYHSATQTQLYDAAKNQPNDWPWAALDDNNPEHRVYYAQEYGGTTHTIVHVQRPTEEHAQKTGDRMGPKRRYAGSILLMDGAMTDFTGDGYHDLMLWKSPPPPITINGLSKALARGEWEYEIIIHEYDAETGRFRAAPWQRYSLTAPIIWFMGGTPPMKHFFAADLNNDGLSDFGFSQDERRFQCFISAQGEKSTSTVFPIVLSDSLTGIAFIQPCNPDGKQVLGLRSPSALHVLLPNEVKADAVTNDPGAYSTMVNYLRGLVEDK